MMCSVIIQKTSQGGRSMKKHEKVISIVAKCIAITLLIVVLYVWLFGCVFGTINDLKPKGTHGQTSITSFP